MRLVLLGLLIIFAVLVYFAAQELYTIPFTQDLVKEPFQAAPTRAADCRCLPGYIPAKATIKPYNGKIYSSMLAGDTAYLFNPTGTKSLYFISPANPCNLLNSSNSGSETFEFMNMDDVFRNKSEYSWNGLLDCSIVKAAEPSSSQDTYFCQNLNDSQKTKACY